MTVGTFLFRESSDFWRYEEIEVEQPRNSTGWHQPWNKKTTGSLQTHPLWWVICCFFPSDDLSYYRPQRSCGKVMFLHLPVNLFTGGEGRAWQGMCGGGGHAWWGTYMAGACKVGGGSAWWGDWHVWWGGYAWQRGCACVAGETATAVGPAVAIWGVGGVPRGCVCQGGVFA